jgi:hypothetical protein
MNKARRLVVIGAVGLFLVLSLFPPWVYPYGSGTIREWRLLFVPPTSSGSAMIDWVILGFEWFVVVVAAGVLLWVFRQGQSSANLPVGGKPNGNT